MTLTLFGNASRLCLVVLMLFAAPAQSQQDAKRSGCFLLYDVDAKRIIVQHGSDLLCDARMAPNSTFKIALSLMAYDSKLIKPDSIFKWDGSKHPLPQWQHDQTPHTWLRDSVLWVSRQLTPRLGLDKIKKYLHDFQYGNEDFSGTHGRHDALTQAWLSNSLQITATEQLHFLIRLLRNQLPIHSDAIDNTKRDLYLEKLANSWRLYGKTGSGQDHMGNTQGWFIGFIEKHDKQLIFVSNLTSTDKCDTVMLGGKIAKAITLKLILDYIRSTKV